MNNRYTIQIRGNVDIESEKVLYETLEKVLQAFPNFVLTFKSFDAWTDMNGKLRTFDEDGNEVFSFTKDEEETDESINNDTEFIEEAEETNQES